MKRLLNPWVSLLMMTSSSLAAEMAMGLRVGEVTQTSAIVWTRITRDAERKKERNFPRSTWMNRHQDGFEPLSREFLLARGSCCDSGCVNCPYPKSDPACPVCGAELEEIRTKLVCRRCHTICETCCDGGRIG